MGLLSHISRSGFSKEQSRTAVTGKSGLLAKAEAQKKTFRSFHEWAFGNGFSHCGVFTQIHGMMVLTSAYNIDSQIIANSVSSGDFWNGTLNTDKRLYKFTKDDQNFYNFLQFFPFELRGNVTHLSFAKTGNGKNESLVMTYNIAGERETPLSDAAMQSFPAAASEKNDAALHFSSEIQKNAKKNGYELFSLDLNEAVCNAIKSAQLPEEKIRKAITACISEQIFDMLARALPEPNFVCKDDNCKIKAAVLKNGHFDDALLQMHITLLLKTVLCGVEAKPVFIKAGTSNDPEKIASFLSASEKPHASR